MIMKLVRSGAGALTSFDGISMAECTPILGQYVSKYLKLPVQIHQAAPIPWMSTAHRLGAGLDQEVRKWSSTFHRQP